METRRRVSTFEDVGLDEKLVARLRAGVKIAGVETLVEPVREYRLVIRFRGDGLGDNVCDTDPLSTGLYTLEPKAGDPASEKTARIAAEFLRQRSTIRDNQPGAELNNRLLGPKGSSSVPLLVRLCVRW